MDVKYSFSPVLFGILLVIALASITFVITGPQIGLASGYGGGIQLFGDIDLEEATEAVTQL